jgi:hypothetical protein
MSADRIDQRRTLAHEQLPGPMQHQHRLLLLRLDFNKAHGRARHRLSFPKIPSGLDSHRKAESSHH